MALTLPFLGSDFLFELSELLSANELCKLYFTGSKILCDHLFHCVRTFKHHPSARRSYFWPKLISSFPNLLTVDLALENERDIDRNLYCQSDFLNADFNDIPKSVRMLHLEFASALINLQQLPFIPDSRGPKGSIDFTTRFPNLISVKLPLLAIHACFDPAWMVPLFNSDHLTILHLPSEFYFPSMSIKCLGPQVTDLSITLRFYKNCKEPIFPKSLTKLRIRGVPCPYPMHLLPRSITDLNIMLIQRRAPTNVEGLTGWPQGLKKLKIDGLNVILDEVIAKLPRMLEYLCLYCWPTKSSYSLLPRGLKTLKIIAGGSSAMPDSNTDLPPSLTSIPSDFFDDSTKWKHLPRTITKVNDTHYTVRIISTNDDAPYIPDLPPALTTLAISCDPMPEISHLINLTKLEVESEVGEVEFAQICKLSCLTCLKMYGYNMKDPSLLKTLTVPLTELLVNLEDCSCLDFSSKWAEKLETLFIGGNRCKNEEDMDIMEELDPNIEEQEANRTLIQTSFVSPLPTHHRLPASLTKLSCNQPYNFPFPRSKEEWPPNLTRFSEAKSGFPFSSFSLLPPSLISFTSIVGVRVSLKEIDDVLAVLSLLPTNIQEINFAYPSFIPTISPGNLIFQYAKSRPALLVLRFNSINMRLEEEKLEMHGNGFLPGEFIPS
jgi:hypothetical protein